MVNGSGENTVSEAVLTIHKKMIRRKKRVCVLEGGWDGVEGSNCSIDRYMIHLYCLVVQAGFYSDVVECWPVKQTVRVRNPAAA